MLTLSFFKKVFAAFTKRERVSFWLASAVIIVSIGAIAGIIIIEKTRAVPASGGQYTEGIIGQPEYVNPVTAKSETDRDLVRMVYSNIYDIADKIEISSDTKTWTIRLKENLHWQDDTRLTSDDVIFTVQEIQNKDSDSPLSDSWAGVAVSRISELELQFSLVKPYAFFGDNLKGLYILPKHLFADIPPGNWRLSDYNLKPVGSGPYSFSSYEKRPDGFITSYHLKAWDGYFGTKPLIQNFDFQFSNNKDLLIQNFNSGQVDGFGGISPENITNIKRPYDLFAFRIPNYYAVFLNQTKNPALEDVAVRKALSLVINKNTLVNQVLGGYGKPDDGPIPYDAAYNASTPTLSSLDLASTTLDDAGWKITNEGLRIKNIGKSSIPLSITLVVPQVSFLLKTADIIKESWKTMGVQVTIIPDSPDNIAKNIIPNRTYDALLFGIVLGPSSDLYPFWDSTQSLAHGLNLAMYNNPKVNSLLDTIRGNPDNEARAAQFANVQNIITFDYPAVFLYSTNYLYITNKTIHGIATDVLSDPSDRFKNAGNWYLNMTRVLK